MKNFAVYCSVAWCFLQSLVCAQSSSGHFAIGPNCSFNVKTGQPECMIMVDGDGTEPIGYPSGKQYLFRMEQHDNRRYFRPAHGAAMALSADQGQKACLTADYTKRPLRVDNLPLGSFICMRTRSGRYGQFTLEKVDKPPRDSIELTYVLW